MEYRWTISWEASPDVVFSSSPIIFLFKINCFELEGKSMFLLYLLARRLQEQKPTVFRLNDARCFYFNETYKGARITAQEMFDMADKENERVWVLTDAPLTDESWGTQDYQWFIVLAASPNLAKTSFVWDKGRSPGIYYMSNWRWGEIFAALWYNFLVVVEEIVAN